VDQERSKFMPIVPLLEREQIPSDRPMHPFETAQRVVGQVLNFHRTVGHSPRALDGFVTLSVALKEMQLDRKLRELAYLRTAQLNHCSY
jgi:alkylhydroperoxidase family enzyme